MDLNNLTDTTDKQAFEPSALVEYGEAEALTRAPGGQPASVVEGPGYTS